MKPIKLFYQARCPFCKRAFNYIDELKNVPNIKTLSSKPLKKPNTPISQTNMITITFQRFTSQTKRYTRVVSIPTKSKLFSKRLWYKNNEKFLLSLPRVSTTRLRGGSKKTGKDFCLYI